MPLALQRRPTDSSSKLLALLSLSQKSTRIQRPSLLPLCYTPLNLCSHFLPSPGSPPPPQALFLGLKLSLSQEFCTFIRLAVLLLSPFLADTLTLCENKLLSSKMAQELSHCPSFGFYPQNHAGPFTHSMAQVFSSHTQNGNVILPPCALHSLFLAHLSQALLNFHCNTAARSSTHTCQGGQPRCPRLTDLFSPLHHSHRMNCCHFTLHHLNVSHQRCHSLCSGTSVITNALCSQDTPTIYKLVTSNCPTSVAVSFHMDTLLQKVSLPRLGPEYEGSKIPSSLAGPAYCENLSNPTSYRRAK